ncbi:MAG: hypothetical protein JWQ21_2177 [Herminiimonas sp.]|nr:hypothetical protein [Herminiimonas sp.]
MNKLITALICTMMAGVAAAKLPPLSADAKAKADETKDKAAWSDKVAAYQLCVVQDKIAARYRKTKGADDKSPAPATAASPAPAIPSCQDPGPYVATQGTAKTGVGMADSLPVPAAGKPPAPGEAKK